MTPAPGRAALWMAGAIASFCALAVAGRVVGQSLTTFEIMLYRSVLGLGLVIAGAAAFGTLATIRARRMGLHLSRNLAHFAGQNLWFYAITVLPLAQVFALEFTAPVWAILLAPLVLGERLTRRGLTAAAIGFAGILIVTRPDPAALSPGLIAAAACAVGFALSMLFTKRLTRTESLTAILFWLNLMQLGFALAVTLAAGGPAPPAHLPWLVLIGVTGLSAHLCLTRALQLAPATIVGPMDFARLPVIALVGAAFYEEPIDALVLIGGAIIFAANWINLRPPRLRH